MKNRSANSALFLFLALFLLLTATGSLLAQGSSCAQAVEFCPFGEQDAVTFPAGTNTGFAEEGNNYGCLITTPNPAWYYLEIGAAGEINIDLTNSNIRDIDFALWGPFPDLAVGLETCGTLGSPLDCSYSPSSSETVFFNAPNVGEVYLLLITNFSNQPTDIFGTETGTGEIACCMSALQTGADCTAASSYDCTCWNRGLELTLSNADGVTPDGFCGEAERYRWASFAACSCAATIEISAADCAEPPPVRAQLYSECGALTPHTLCKEIADAEGAFLTDESGDIKLNFVVDQTYSLLLAGNATDTCTYRVTVTVSETDPPIIEADTLAGVFTICPFDTVTYAFPVITGTDEYDAVFSAGDATISEVSADLFTVQYGEADGTLCVRAFNCTDTVSLCREVTVLSASECDTSTDLLHTAAQNVLTIFPNPVAQRLTFFADLGSLWEISDSRGRPIMQGVTRAAQTRLSVADLPPGVYFLRVRGQLVKSAKFIKE